MSSETAPAHLRDLPTPCLVVDKAKLLANAARMTARMKALGVVHRPHLKTVKSVPVAKLLVGETGAVTVSTLKEAEEFAAAGFKDILYAVGIAPQKLPRVTALRRRGAGLKIILDSVDAAEAVARHANETGDAIPALIEIDVDGHRAGVPLSEKHRLVEIGRILDASKAELAGVLTHAGESYALSDPDALTKFAERERAGAVAMADTLRAAGLPCPIVSVGSTPTSLAAAGLDGVTEVRSGVYAFFDLVQAGIGVCAVEDIAMSVLATVIGRQRHKGWVLTDAGWMALSSDRGTSGQETDQFYGLVCDEAGAPFGDLVVIRASQEQGTVALRPGAGGAVPDFAVGDRLRILPNHACNTAAQHARYYAIDGDGNVTDVWERFGGW
ncbi:MAG: alanine racemase [Oricola sp.]|jgi:D-serine deaminase-like pyridoxal phosphate-dependent protein|nr:alanine racemase [Oricola sp.]